MNQAGLDQLLSGGKEEIPPKGIVILGATGDMVSKRESRDALAYLAEKQIFKLPNNPIRLAAGSHPVSGAQFMQTFRNGDSSSHPLSSQSLSRFQTLAGLDVAGSALPAVDVRKAGDLANLALPRPRNLLYAALPPRLYEPLLEALAGTEKFEAVVLEKPLGTNLESAQRLLKLSQKTQVLLIDHFLAYPGTLNLLALRAWPEVDEALSRDFMDSLQVVLGEKILSNDRPYFRETGCVVDMIQSHALLLLASLAMERPRSWSGGELQQSRLALLNRLDLHPETARWGQFEGFNDPQHGAPPGAEASEAETFVTFDFRINDARWQHVPCQLRNGKGVAEDFFGLEIQFSRLPRPLAHRLGLSANQATSLSLEVRHGHFHWSQNGSRIDVPLHERIVKRPPHALLLPDALKGVEGLFVSPSEALCCWEFTEKLQAALKGRRKSTYPIGANLSDL